MQFLKDLVQAEPVYRSFPLKNATAFTNGAVVQLDTTVATTEVTLGAPTHINNVGVYCGPAITSSGTVAAGTSQYGKILVNPFAVYAAEYDKAADLTATNFGSGVVTATSEAKPGDWLLNNSPTSKAYGLLLYIASTSTTASMTALTTSAYAGGVTPGTTDHWVHIHGILTGQLANQYARIDLDATATKILTDATYTGVGITLLDNHIRSEKSTSNQPLRRVTHNNTIDSTYKIYGEIMLTDNIWVKI